MSLEIHKQHKGKLSVVSKVKIETAEDLSVVYTPGVAEPCRRIAKQRELVYKYTSKGNLVAVVTDGTAVLGLGNIGPEAAMPVMEGKAILFKEFANIDAFPICLATNDVDEIVSIVKAIAPTFGGINLEDISAPRCIEIERRLKKELDIPVFHDDQHGTAIVVSAALINALKLTKRRIENSKIVINGAGAAGSAIAKMLVAMGAKRLYVCDREGVLYRGMEGLNSVKEEVAKITNSESVKGSLPKILNKADVFIGVSCGDVVSEEMVKSMNEKAIVFPMANPYPEIIPELAKKAEAYKVGTGRSDFVNQTNNVIAFPGVFKGALDARATDINEKMKIAAVNAIASIILDDELSENYIIPSPFDRRIVENVSSAVRKAAIESGVANEL